MCGIGWIDQGRGSGKRHTKMLNSAYGVQFPKLPLPCHVVANLALVNPPPMTPPMMLSPAMCETRSGCRRKRMAMLVRAPVATSQADWGGLCLSAVYMASIAEVSV